MAWSPQPAIYPVFSVEDDTQRIFATLAAAQRYVIERACFGIAHHGYRTWYELCTCWIETAVLQGHEYVIAALPLRLRWFHAEDVRDVPAMAMQWLLTPDAYLDGYFEMFSMVG